MTDFHTSRGPTGGGRSFPAWGILALAAGGVILLFILLAVGGLVAYSLLKPTPDATEVLEGLKDEGLPVGQSEIYTAENDPNELLGRPGQYSGKVTFKDTRLSTDDLAGDSFDVRNGGSIETFENEEDAATRQEYLKAVSEIPMFAEYAFREGTVLLRVSTRLTPSQAAEYEAALKEAV